ncbi:hypothetical protein OH76DRAFT_779662 [Lentinus brumalis]|uniref:Uncharacterized protein n=1 Tax=Lentinus brumalis TaxID=2498619 RepID=A0A371D4F3_9APHY|nr:hypothetical protein OH76DRAFT_779662 [Polyporus brumalis]
MACRRRRVIPPNAAPIAEWRFMEYGDGGELRVKRWPSSPDVDLQFRAPIWDWVNGQLAYSPNHRIRFARILAEAVNATAAGQGIDGNLGLGVPGWRKPWLLAGSKDRATFFDVINNGPGIVPTPMCVTMRLLPPDGYQLAHANKRVQSFLYFGNGSPCGLFLEFLEDKIRIPEYTPKLYIYPDIVMQDVFNWWSLQLLSITLLEPLVDNPNYAGTDPLQWMPRHIPLGEQLPNGASTGVRVIFDNGCGCSIFPRHVLQAIWTQWFQNDAQFYPTGAVYLRHFRDFSRHDVVFQFRDSHGKVEQLRCRANEFLTSPWNTGDALGGSYACFAEPQGGAEQQQPGDEELGDEEPGDEESGYEEPGYERPGAAQPGVGKEPYILGVNFFWASILRLDASHRGEQPVLGQAKPFMQLAPQRLLSHGFELAGPWNLEIHPDLPPDMQATLREQPELLA